MAGPTAKEPGHSLEPGFHGVLYDQNRSCISHFPRAIAGSDDEFSLAGEGTEGSYLEAPKEDASTPVTFPSETEEKAPLEGIPSEVEAFERRR